MCKASVATAAAGRAVQRRNYSHKTGPNGTVSLVLLCAPLLKNFAVTQFLELLTSQASLPASKS